ncbi:MAG TPA: carbohydrate binding domain-containing protein [Candidatus Saccharimonadales bacterium]|nr:carbohydrate binding domain-containing protein [Candidatus Saccharimonadales bacterium]
MGIGVTFFYRKLLSLLLLTGAVFAFAYFMTNTAHAVAGVNEQMNFQGRLLTAEGATVPDGFYNIEFKIYQDGDGKTVGDATGTPAGTLKWTEDYLNKNGTGVEVRNGFLSVQLGSVNPFGSSIDWNQDTLWLSMNIAGTNATCTPFSACSPDGEMVPMKRLSANAYALNSKRLGGMSSSQFLQLAQGVQTDASTNASIAINKTGSGNFMNLQSSGTSAFTLSNSGDVAFGANANHTLSVATAAAGAAGASLTVSAGNAGSGNLNGGDLILVAGSGSGLGVSGQVVVQSVLSVQAGPGIVANFSGRVVGAAAQASDEFVTKAQLDAVGGGGAQGTGTAGQVGVFDSNGAVQGSDLNWDNSNKILKVASGNLAIQGSNATTSGSNGGNLVLSGGSGSGSGISGLVVISTPTFSATTNDANCYTGGLLVPGSCTIATSSVDNSATIVVGFSKSGNTAILPPPTNSTVGRVVYITAANGSQDFTLSVNGGGTGNEVAMRQNSSATMVWNGSAWAAAGASSSTTLQAAYDNTLQSAGGAELVVSHTGNTNGLTIRDSSTFPVDGTLMSVQTSSAATLMSINSNVTEYASDGGAETQGSSPSTFPAGTWTSTGSATMNRYITSTDNIATGKASVSVTTSTAAQDGVKNALSTVLNANMHYNVSFATRLGSSGTFTDMNVYYSPTGGTTGLIPCSTGHAIASSVWTKINCTFTAPASGMTASNALYIRQTSGGTARTFYIDNLSVTIAADYNYASDPGVDDDTNFATNWGKIGSATVSRSTATGNDASDSAQVVTTGANQGIRNKLSINPLTGTLYRLTIYAASTTTGFNSFTIRYTPDGGTSFVNCVDYNTQTVSSSLTDFTEINCYLKTGATAASSPYVYFTQTDATARTFYVDTFSMTLTSNTAPNVQIGGGVNGGPVTLFTLDRAASAPIAVNNDAFLGSMYYDTSLGKLQCYEADGWGACGSSPDTIVTISPEYTNAVMHGTGVGTMTSDICSDSPLLNLNNGSGGQPSICNSGETYNFYRWTSPQFSAQTYSIYVTYQLPGTFKGFASGQTSIMARTDSSNATVRYTVYRSDSSNLIQCGPPIAVSSGAVSSWQPGVATGATDPSTCSFAPGNSIVFKIDMVASQNANAYVSNLNFTFSNK